MSKPTYNWQIEKQNFFDSPYLSVREFLVSFLSVDPKNASNGSFSKATKGWTEEKKDFLRSKVSVSNQKTIENPEIRSRVEILQSYLDVIVDSVSYLVTKKRRKITVTDSEGNQSQKVVLDLDLKDMKDLKIGYDILRLETGQSTQNTGNVNLEDIINELKK